jgi:hypothetical protein
MLAEIEQKLLEKHGLARVAVPAAAEEEADDAAERARGANGHARPRARA